MLRELFSNNKIKKIHLNTDVVEFISRHETIALTIIVAMLLLPFITVMLVVSFYD